MSRARSSPAHTRLFALTFALLLALAAATPAHPRPRARRQLAEDNSLQPEQEAQGEVAGRPKRKLEGLAQAGFGIKNAVLGFAFGKVNSIIDAKTRLVETLDRTNIEKNRALGIETPRNDGLASLGGIVGQIAGPLLQLVGPKIQAVSGLLGGLSGGSSSGSGGSSGGAGGASNINHTYGFEKSGTTWRRLARAPGLQPALTSSRQRREATPQLPLALTSAQADTPLLATSPQRTQRATQEELLVSPLSLPRQPERISHRAAPARPQRQAPKNTADDIPVFDRNKVSLDFPGSLFGPSVSLLIKTTKIVGDVIQNSAVRYQTFLRLFRPLFRGPFEIKGLDPPTTTTTTTTTPAPVATDNEVRRR